MSGENQVPEDMSSQHSLATVAADWVQRINDDTVSDADIAGWLQWYREDEAHRQAFDRADLFFRKVSTAAPSYKDIMRREGAERASRRPWPARPVTWALAASVVVCTVVAITGYFISGRQQVHVERYETQRGEHRRIVLPDGSSAVVGALSKLDVAFDVKERHVTILSGEGFFEVSHEAARPFVVRAGGTLVTALGTAFDVRLSENHVAVSVVSGVVEIKRPAPLFSAPLEATRLAAGDQAVMSSLARSPSVEVSHIQPETATTWQRGYFSFAGEPLSSVIDSVNRYAKRRIEIGDPRIGEMTYAGTVFWDRADEWAENLTQIFPISVLERGDGVIVLLQKEK